MTGSSFLSPPAGVLNRPGASEGAAASHLVDEHVERLLQSSSVPAAHGEEAEAHPHVEPLADSAAPGQSRLLLLVLLLAPRSAPCTRDRGPVVRAEWIPQGPADELGQGPSESCSRLFKRSQHKNSQFS